MAHSRKIPSAVAAPSDDVIQTRGNETVLYGNFTILYAIPFSKAKMKHENNGGDSFSY